MPSLERLYQKYQDKGLTILMINTRESKENVGSFIRHNHYSFKVLRDADGEVSRTFSVFGLPAGFIIDKKGRAVFRSVGYRNWNTKKMHEAFDTLIEE